MLLTICPNLMNNIGWIKLHRKIRDWEGYPNIKRLGFLVYLLLKANWEDKEWQGITIKRGSFVTSIDNLCYGTGINERQTRYLLSVMQSAGEVSIKGTNKYTVISINNFDSYQENCQTNVKQSVKQTTNKVSTTKEDKNIRSKEIYINIGDIEEIAKKYNVEVFTVKNLYEDMVLYCQRNGKKYKDYKAALMTWVRTEMKNGKLKQIVKNIVHEDIVPQIDRESNLRNVAKMKSQLANKLHL
jgi:uncharacterized protein (UPF0147 family)